MTEHHQDSTTPPAAATEPVRAPPVLDEAHVGDIQGAPERSPERHRRAQLLARPPARAAGDHGAGLIVMVGDNDAGGVATYAQAGQNYGPSLLWC